MTVFGCRTCGSALTIPVSQVAFPVHAHQRYGNGPGALEPAMEPVTFAVDPLPSGDPSRPWAELEPGEAEARGWYAPRSRISDGPAGHVLLAPGDVRNAIVDPALASEFACCGLNSSTPNTVCLTCGTPVAIRIDDCGYRHALWLDPTATHVIEDGPGPMVRLDWMDLAGTRPGIPPSEPDGQWNPMWTAAVASALAHLLAASGGGPIVIPDHQVAAIFQHTLNRLTAPGPERTLVLAGPALPTTDGDLALVPVHPQTGDHWPVQPPMKPIPLAWDAWHHLAFHRDPKPVGRSAPIPPDAPPGLLPGYWLRPDSEVFLSVLARLPEVKEPWLRAIYDQSSRYDYRYFPF
jgi:hypothetical protein